jgi:hypothetical protein
MENAGNREPKDRWSKAEIILSAVSGVLLPLAVAGVGGVYTYLQDKHNDDVLIQQRQNEQVRQRSEQATTLLTHLASDSARERLLAVKVTEQLAKDNLLPSELVPVLVEIAKNDDSSGVSGAATEAVASTTKVTTVSAAGTQETVSSQAQTTLAALPVRVYIHIRSEDQRKPAQKVAAALQAKGFLVPGIELVNVGPKESELRYFQGSNKDDTDSLIADLQTLRLDVSPVDLSERYKNSPGIRPRHYELWFGPTAFQEGSATSSSKPNNRSQPSVLPVG